MKLGLLNIINGFGTEPIEEIQETAERTWNDMGRIFRAVWNLERNKYKAAGIKLLNHKTKHVCSIECKLKFPTNPKAICHYFFFNYSNDWKQHPTKYNNVTNFHQKISKLNK